MWPDEYSSTERGMIRDQFPGLVSRPYTSRDGWPAVGILDSGLEVRKKVRFPADDLPPQPLFVVYDREGQFLSQWSTLGLALVDAFRQTWN